MVAIFVYRQLLKTNLLLCLVDPDTICVLTLDGTRSLPNRFLIDF